MDQNRKNSWNTALAAVLLVGLFGSGYFGSGYAISTQTETTTSVAPLSTAPQEQPAPTVYYPSQFVKPAEVTGQAQRAEEHIQAF